MSHLGVNGRRMPPPLAALFEQIAATERRMAVLQAELRAINAALASGDD